MNTEILERAKYLYHQSIWIPSSGEYIDGIRGYPESMTPYHNGDDEPVVKVNDICELDSNVWLTVNRYNAIVLNSRNMFIADIDFGDERLNRFAGAKSINDVVRNLDELDLLDHIDYGCHRSRRFGSDIPSLAKQSYRVYRTHSGCRVICTSHAFPRDRMDYAADCLMRFLRSDPQYIKLCDVQKCYRARLTPKPWRQDEFYPNHVCQLSHIHGDDIVHPELVSQMTLHDEMTFAEEPDSALA